MALSLAAKYPFSSQAKQKAGEGKFRLSGQVIEAAEDQIKKAFEGGSVGPALLASEEAYLASYAASRMILAAMKNRVATSYFASAVAKKCAGYLDEETGGDFKAISIELGVQFTKPDKLYLVPFGAYLSFAPRRPEFSLSKRKLAKGMVPATKSELLRLLESAIKKRVERTGMLQNPPPAIAEAANRLAAHVPKSAAAPTNLQLEEGGYPPCIKKIMDDLAAGEHVTHSARWSLAVFLVHAGIPFEKMVEIFAASPDYNDRTTRYQLQYVKDKNYSMPSCNTMESNGIALVECPCLSANADFRRGRPVDYAKKKRIVETKKVVK